MLSSSGGSSVYRRPRASCSSTSGNEAATDDLDTIHAFVGSWAFGYWITGAVAIASVKLFHRALRVEQRVSGLSTTLADLAFWPFYVCILVGLAVVFVVMYAISQEFRRERRLGVRPPS